MTHIERCTGLSQADIQKSTSRKEITKVDIFNRFGFDYRSVVEQRLRHWDKLPRNHKLNFFNIAEVHKGSSGLYLLEEIVGNDWVFLQAMFENGISTKHMHGENVIELYDPLAGESILTVNGNDHKLNVGVPFEVFPGQAHQLKTNEKSSLNLLVMKNSAHIPRNKLHIPAI